MVRTQPLQNFAVDFGTRSKVRSS